MSLFSIDDINQPRKSGSAAIRHKGPTRFVVGNSQQTLTEVIQDLPQVEEAIEFVSTGDWSVHDLLFYVLEKTGPAAVHFTTWAISEYAIRQLYNYVTSGLITDLTGIFDYRNVTVKSAEFHFLKRISPNVKPSRVHAKVTVVENEQWSITIAGSGNYTRNPRIEIGIIRNSKTSCAFHKKWIHEQLVSRSF